MSDRVRVQDFRRGPVPRSRGAHLATQRPPLQHREGKPPSNTLAQAAGSHAFGRVPLYPDSSAMIQTKLVIGAPDDEFEREADRIADEVMRMPDPRIQQASPTEEDEADQLQAKPLADQLSLIHI